MKINGDGEQGTTAPASIRSSAHAAGVKSCSLNRSKLSQWEPVAIPSSPSSFSFALHDNRCCVIRQQLPQTFDVIVMDAAAGFGYGPLECPT